MTWGGKVALSLMAASVAARLGMVLSPRRARIGVDTSRAGQRRMMALGSTAITLTATNTSSAAANSWLHSDGLVRTMLSTVAIEAIDDVLGRKWAWLAKPLVEAFLGLLGFVGSRQWVYRR